MAPRLDARPPVARYFLVVGDPTQLSMMRTTPASSLLMKTSPARPLSWTSCAGLGPTAHAEALTTLRRYDRLLSKQVAWPWTGSSPGSHLRLRDAPVLYRRSSPCRVGVAATSYRRANLVFICKRHV